MALPDFLIVGAPKAGSTALHVALAKHPQLHLASLGRYGEQLEHLRSLFDPEAIHVLRYRQLVERPDDALDGICRFLGVEPGLVSVVPSENVSTFVDDTPFNSVLRAGIRSCASLGAHFPPQVWRTASKPLLKALRRQHANRPELSPEQRSELAAVFTDDIALLERLTGESFADWLGWRPTGTFSVRKASAASA